MKLSILRMIELMDPIRDQPADDVDTCAECGHPVDEHAEHYGCWACPCSLNPGPFDPSDG